MARVTFVVEKERPAGSAFGALLRRHRLAAGLSQEDLAEQARMSARGIGALERGNRRYPYRETVVLLAKALSLEPGAAAEFEAAGVRPREPRSRTNSEAAAAKDPRRATTPLSPVVDRRRSFFAALPSPRNLYFTGREALLEQVRDNLQASQRVALSGLGGLGKTQTALEYVYRHGEAYDHVFWIHAETDSTITSGFVEIADLLAFPQHSTTEAQQLVAAVLRWLETHERWLLIADNADDPRLLRPFLPRVANGHLLVTTRAQVLTMLGITNALQIPALSSAEALRFLLTRTGRDDASPQERTAAQTLAAELGHLPLALEQAAAYIHENGTRFADYVAGYRTRRLKLLARGIPADSPAKSVTTTWQIAFERLAAEPAAADLLRASAFLSPDRIPLELIAEGAADLGPAIAQALPNFGDQLELDELLAPLTRYSLVAREPESGSYSLHRLVQEVTKDALDGETQRTWVERVIGALNRLFADVEYATWTRCERLLAHAQVAAQLIARHELVSPDAARLLHQTASYLYARGRFTEAEPLFHSSLSLRERLFGAEHPDVAQTLSALAELCSDQGRYGEAEPLYWRSLTIRQGALGPEHLDVGQTLFDLGWINYVQRRDDEAERLYRQSLVIRERALGPEHGDVALTLKELAELLLTQGRLTEAEPLYRRSLSIGERALGSQHPDFAHILSGLETLCVVLARYAEAATFGERALTIREHVLGTEHPYVSSSLCSLASVYRKQGRYVEAEACSQRSLALLERTQIPEHPYVALTLCFLAWTYRHQGRFGEAEPMCRRALAIRERVFGPEHPLVAESLYVLGLVCRDRAQYPEAESSFRRALAIDERVQGAEDLAVARSLNGLGLVYNDQQRYAEAESLFLRSLTIRERALGPEHPYVAESLNNLAELYHDSGRFAEAEPHLYRSLMIRERMLGAHHPDVAQSLNGLARLRYDQGQFAEAKPLFRRSLAIRDRVLGSKHPDVADSLNGLADVHREQGQYAKAEALYRRSLTILEGIFEAGNPKLAMTRQNLAVLYDHIGRDAAM